MKRSAKASLFKGGKQEPFITTYNATDNRECKAKTIFMIQPANLNHVICLKPSGNLNNIKSGVNRLTYVYDVKWHKLTAVNLPYK